MEDESGLDLSSDTKQLTFSDFADELCPYYMAIGMPCDEYWHGDYTQLSYYRGAHKLRQEQKNHDAWLQGGYFYDALCMVAPMLHAFAKRGVKPIPYHKEPYKFGEISENNEDKPAKTDKEIQEIQALNASARFASFMTQFNKKFEKNECL